MITISIISKELNIHRDTARKIIDVLVENSILELLESDGKSKIYIKKYNCIKCF